MSYTLAPIVLFVYNRPTHTKKVIEALLSNELSCQSELYVFADGPKEGISEYEKKKIDDTRKYISTITGFKKITIIEQPKNKGLDNSEIEGITDIINSYDKVIVLEDDVIVHKYFLQFMNEALDFYSNVQNVFTIGSYSPSISYIDNLPADVYSSYRSATFGWGTWKDRWNQCKWDKSYVRLSKILSIKKYNRGGGDLYDNLVHYLKGLNDAWDARWQYCMYENNGVCIRPVKSFSYNIGYDGTGEHCGIVTNDSIMPILYDKEEYNVKFINNVRVKGKVKKEMYNFFKYDKVSFVKKIKWKIKSIIKFIFKK